MIKINAFKVRSFEDAFQPVEYENMLLEDGYTVDSIHINGFVVKIGVPDGDKPLSSVEAVNIAKEFLAHEAALDLLP